MSRPKLPVNLAIIPARGGSKRIPLKNIRPFYGKPIIGYSIAAAKQSGLFGKVIVSTDDKRIGSYAISRGASLHHRPRELADDITGTQEVVRNVLEWWRLKARSDRPELVCCIYATAPMLQPADLTYGLAMLARAPYAYVHGIYYWGHAEAFLNEVPLSDGVEVPYPSERYIDINTEDDWRKAETMYRLRKEAA